jgi:hypothetical protein
MICNLKSNSHPRLQTDEGRMISTKPVRMNEEPSIRDNLNPDSNVTEQSDRHSEKHLKPKTSTEPRKITNFSSVPRKYLPFNFP